MIITSSSFSGNKAIPAEFAFCAPDAQTHCTPGANRNPQLYGYDGPCPPWNDSIVHHYVFTLYALDVEQCGVSGTFKGGDVRKAITGHVLAEAKITGLYSLNPAVKT